MKIQTRVLLLMISMTTLSMIAAIAVSSYLSRDYLQTAAQEKLSTVLQLRYSEVTSLLEALKKNMNILALDNATTSGLSAMSEGYARLGKDAQSLLQNKYKGVDQTGRKFNSPALSTSFYEQAHGKYAPIFLKRCDAYGWEDMYLIDTRGNVVFSTLKKSEFATNLVSGPWKDSGLARAVKPLLHDAVPGMLSFADFSVYAPRGRLPAAFVAIPIFDEDKHGFLGVAAIQFPIKQLNSLMHNETGLEETGESLVVGKDGLMLSDSRFDKEGSVLRAQIKSTTVQRVLAGEAGQGESIDYLNHEAFEAFKPLQPFPGALGDHAQWGVIAKIDKDEVLKEFYDLRLKLLITAAELALITLAVGLRGALSITRPLVKMKDALNKLSRGEHTGIPGLERTDEIGEMAHAAELFHEMAQHIERDHWIAENVAVVTSTVSSELALKKAADNVLHLLCDKLEVPVGAIYLLDRDCYRLAVAHGLAPRDHAEDCFPLGVGVIGQCAKDREPVVISPVPVGLPAISTGLAEFQPQELVIYPILHKDKVLAVLELAALKALTPLHHEFLKAACAALGLHMANLQSAEHNSLLLEETRRQSLALKEQQDSLLRKNEEMQDLTAELRAQAEEMKAQNEELRANQEEMRAQQEEMKHKNIMLETQSSKLKEAIHEIETKANDLQRANQYKSEFLANMSHELRTPLNSVLILSKTLAENEENNLTHEQVESARVISESGTQLLMLINDILDLSKVEAGKLELRKQEFMLDDILAYLRRVFSPQAEKKHLGFHIKVDAALPEMIYSDRQRLTQILTNLLANAIKFTDRGEVRLLVSKDDEHLQFEVIDTGIGIPADKLEHIFGVFQQVDGSASRKYGGSGLGLPISRNLAALLGGEITVKSQLGKGSSFTLRLFSPFSNPELPAGQKRESKHLAAHPATLGSEDSANAGISILVVEDDARLRAILERMIRAFGFSPVSAGSAEQALEAVAESKPVGILLDLGLPRMSGMEMLRRLKSDEVTAQIPVYIMSGAADSGEAKVLGAKGFLRKPVTRDAIYTVIRAMIEGESPGVHKRILLVDDNPVDMQSIGNMFRKDEVEIVSSNNGGDALQLLQTQRFDTVILDLKLPDMTGFEWLKQARHILNPPPVVVYSARDLSEAEVFELKAVTESIVTKSALNDRLREEVLLALQLDMSSGKIRSPDRKSGAGKKLLLVDDDARNLYALTKVLRSRGYEVEVAADGDKALELLSRSAFAAVLTDIMMPDMDGYALIRQIRKLGYTDIPVIAITAKAMQGDDELCMQAGATAYMAKPVDTGKLFELLRNV